MIVSRTCTEIPARDAERHRPGERQSRPLKEFRDTPAYVLVGDPGAGKTTAFETEREALGEEACLVTARDFLTFDAQNHPEWCGKTLFIDGLDEIRAGSPDVRTPFHQIRGKLDALGKSRFRLSCREADWRGQSDRKHLESVSPDSSVSVLRLDPLTDSDISSILDARSDVPDAGVFIKAAEERRVEGLLTNPQTLAMLADVVGAGEGWPESRIQTFEMACRQMAREHNDEHAAAQEPDGPAAPAQLLGAAGRLCALQLISGSSGYTLRGQPDEEYPALDQCDYDSQLLRLALATKLFKGASSNRFTPVHRHIAEFLGGRHLAKVIRDGLPARRAIALLTGEDSGVVTEMRGLSAWLAAHSPKARMDLIERDPIGAGLYGDIGEFSLHEKRALLESLNREGTRLGPLWQSAAAFEALAAPEMEPVLREILEDGDRGDDQQVFTDFVLRVLTGGPPLPDLGPLLLKIVRDQKRRPGINTSALRAFIHNCPASQADISELNSLLVEIRAKNVSDPDNELLGVLLYELYPRHLSPSQVWEVYLETSDRESLFRRYKSFFWFGLPEKSSDDQIAELLDTQSRRLIDMRPTLKSGSTLENLPAKLLARGLQAHGTQLATKRLYDWLDLGFRESLDDSWVGDKEDILEVRSWMESHAEIQKAVILEGLERCPESSDFWSHAFSVEARWYGASPPSDFGLWCLVQSVAMADKKPLVAEHLLDTAFQAHRDRRGDAGLSLEILREQAREKACLRKRLDQLLAPSPIQERHLRFRARFQEKRRREQEEEQQQIDHVRSNKAALLENRAAPNLLYHMAAWYFSGHTTIEERLRGDRDLIDAVLQGLRGTIDREDVPDQEEILCLREQNEQHFLGRAFLAGVAEADKTTDVSQWDDDRLRKAIAFHYSSDIPNREPQWYRRLLTERPRTVAEVLVQFAASGFGRGREHIDKQGALAHDPDYAEVAQHASLPLLRVFPTRCRLKQMESLHDFLKAAIRHADRRALQELIDTKLSRKSMNDAQRVYWLAAGIIVAPELYRDGLRDFAHAREDRIRHLMAFYFPGVSERSLADDLEGPALEPLIRLLGSHVGPTRTRDEVYWASPETEAPSLVRDLIRRLAASPGKDASDALGRLAIDRELSRWHNELSRAQDEQLVIRRDAGYHHPNIGQICQTLDGGTPTNAADLAALLMDRLGDLARDIRKGNTDDWRQYWNEPRGQSPTPKHEDQCRDALLSDLRPLIPAEVDAQPEGPYANDKRADIRVSCRDFQVPVEVKKSMHPKLWSAVRDQLIAKYTIAPDTGGYGVYLVLWFGKDTKPSPSGGRPADPEELCERLAAEADLTPLEARKISICVVDVSRPAG